MGPSLLTNRTLRSRRVALGPLAFASAFGCAAVYTAIRIVKFFPFFRLDRDPLCSLFCAPLPASARFECNPTRYSVRQAVEQSASAKFELILWTGNGRLRSRVCK